MISWTLDNTTFHYWTLNESGEVIWGYPKHGDEVIIDDRFKYIFKSTEEKWMKPIPQDVTDMINRVREPRVIYSEPIIPITIEIYPEDNNDLVSDLDNDQADEISTYMREAQQMMNNGR